MNWELLVLGSLALLFAPIALCTLYVCGVGVIESWSVVLKAVGRQARRITRPSTTAHAASGGLPWLLPTLFVLLTATSGSAKTSDTFSPTVLASPMNISCHYQVDVRLMSLDVAQKVAERMKCRLVVIGTFPDNNNWMILLGVPKPLHPLVRRDNDGDRPSPVR